MIIGLCGVARSGKDTAAQVLVEKYGFVRVSFADALRDMLYALNPVVLVKHSFVVEHLWDNVLFDKRGHLITMDAQTVLRINHLVDMVGWDTAKTLTEVRELLQRLGTEAGRNILGDDIWIETAMKKASGHENVVITDVRFPNEALAVDDAGGFVIRINRPGFAPVNGHASDQPLSHDLVDFDLVNAGTVEELHRMVEGIYILCKDLSSEATAQRRAA